MLMLSLGGSSEAVHLDNPGVGGWAIFRAVFGTEEPGFNVRTIKNNAAWILFFLEYETAVL